MNGTAHKPVDAQATTEVPCTDWVRLLPLQPGAYARVVVFDAETTGFSLCQ